jgi:hypothetical protein
MLNKTPVVMRKIPASSAFHFLIVSDIRGELQDWISESWIKEEIFFKAVPL